MVLAIEEIVASGVRATLDDVLTALPPGAVHVLLETTPDSWLDPAAQRETIRFDSLVAVIHEGRWTSGRVFNLDFELRWEQYQDGMHLVYCGANTELPGLNGEPLDLRLSRDISCSLWGAAVTDPELVGEPAGALVFAELRIPRLLRYPVSARARFVRLIVREYLDTSSGAVTLSRFCGVQEEP